jgi:hypothetical protein
MKFICVGCVGFLTTQKTNFKISYIYSYFDEKKKRKRGNMDFWISGNSLIVQQYE